MIKKEREGESGVGSTERKRKRNTDKHRIRTIEERATDRIIVLPTSKILTGSVSMPLTLATLDPPLAAPSVAHCFPTATGKGECLCS